MYNSFNFKFLYKPNTPWKNEHIFLLFTFVSYEYLQSNRSISIFEASLLTYDVARYICIFLHIQSISFEGKTQNRYNLFLFVEYGALPPQVLGMPLSFNFVAYPSECLWVGMNLLFCNTNIQAMSWYYSILPTQQWSGAVPGFCVIKYLVLQFSAYPFTGLGRWFTWFSNLTST